MFSLFFDEKLFLEEVKIKLRVKRECTEQGGDSRAGLFKHGGRNLCLVFALLSCILTLCEDHWFRILQHHGDYGGNLLHFLLSHAESRKCRSAEPVRSGRKDLHPAA